MNQLVMSYAWKYNNIEAYVLDLIVNERIEAKVGLLQESSASAWYKLILKENQKGAFK